jgi:electron transport complex protein RnfC
MPDGTARGLPFHLHRFHGGLHLDDHKQESTQRPLQTASLPAQLVLRLKQHIGEPNDPLVRVGDRVLRGQKIADTPERVAAPIHAPTSGTVVAIEDRPVAHPSGKSDRCIVIEPDGRDEAVEFRPVDTGQSDRDSLLRHIREAGIVGLGGAVFPTAAKAETAAAHPIRTLIINGAECEPWITCDDLLMRNRPEAIISGVRHLQRILEPEETLIGIEDNKPEAIAAMQQALDAAGLDNTLVISIPTIYPSGGEKQLIKILTGHEVRSRHLAFEIGLLCQNVGTCAAISDALDRGEPLTHRIVTVTGTGIREPGNWIVPIGTPFSHLVDLAGGFTVARPEPIMGGPMMGFELRLDAGLVKAGNCLLILDRDQRPEEHECVRCGRCTDVCPAQLLPQQLYWYSRARQFDKADDYHLFDCIECGCCAAVCPSHLPLVQLYRYAKSELREQQRKAWKSDRARKRHEFREARIARQKAEEEERRRKKREALAKKKAAEGDGKQPAKAPAGDAVQAALERVKARKAARQLQPKNTDNLTPEQQRQIDEAEARRQLKTTEGDS